ncbi:DUF4124 domain-containing protein [Thiorhodococcus mannitoliphagus]|uniref:DUF4124 domain-containing protein n=1 Tax=Thiorhodococcus mannitoliphagus TaxID=329406 RepID=A0A6P1DRY9_9GAMM|nr:DUF4124 domain-containing protein [Thiorhodococcus mannitoliphagus]NEX18762.1 DUF4124 domain-containing protein [Thiorhodococcus mannitoliphagus]
MVSRYLIIAAVLAPFAVSAEIYRWVDDSGRVHFSDRRSQDSAKVETVLDQGTNTEKAPPATAEPESPDAQFLGPYSTLDIVAPAANETLTQQDDGLPVSLMVDPPLMEGHQMSILLDQAPLPVANGATQFRLTGAALGSHRLQIRVQGEGGSTVAQSAPRRFHVQKPEEPGQLR